MEEFIYCGTSDEVEFCADFDKSRFKRFCKMPLQEYHTLLGELYSSGMVLEFDKETCKPYLAKPKQPTFAERLVAKKMQRKEKLRQFMDKILKAVGI